jgi:putative lipoic acid-binding regulatory protein
VSPVAADDGGNGARIEYPCEWSLRVVADHREHVVAFVGEVLARHVEDFDPDVMTVVPSRAGRYMSVRLRFLARDESHVRTVVHALADHPDVKMIL